MEENKAKFDYSQIPPGFYDKILLEENGVRNFWHSQKFDVVLRALKPFKKGKILDIGCSGGSFLRMLAKNDFSEQYGVDIAKEQINYAKKYETNYRNFIQINKIEDLSQKFDNDYFDAITLVEIIEHLEENEVNKIFKIISKILKPQGQLIITTPNYLSSWPILELIISKFLKPSYEEQHITKFTFFSFFKKLNKIYPSFNQKFTIKYKTTSHLLTFILAGISNKLAKSLSKIVKINNWKFPFGALLVVKITKK